MKLHRFYVGDEIELKHDFWLHDKRLQHQWSNVLRFRAGQELVLFNDTHERLYKIAEIKKDETHLLHMTDFKRKTPSKEIYLLWSLLKKDKNDWVLQKCTELGVSHFIPLLADRSEKIGFNSERARKIVIEAAEQCGRGDIPNIREPMLVETAINELKHKVVLHVCEQSELSSEQGTMSSEQQTQNSSHMAHRSDATGVMIGPEGGWSDREKSLFTEQGMKHLNIHDFTLRAETAAVTAVTKLLQ